MNRLQHILVGVDFSPSARTALEQAVRLANWNGAGIEVVHVVDVRSVFEYAEVTEQPLLLVEKEVSERMQRELENWVAGSNLPREASTHTLIGIPLDVLRRHAEEARTSLLVIGVRGRTSPEGVAGTLALKCLRKTECKVMLVQEGHTGPFRNVIACVDFSESSRVVVEQARRIARQDGCRIHFIHVVTGLWQEIGFHPETEKADTAPDGKYRRDLLARLHEFAGPPGELETAFTIVDASTASRGIVEYSIETGADLVILGSKGESNLKYVLLGSTVERLLREVPCSVLVVRTQEQPKGAPMASGAVHHASPPSTAQ